MKNNTLCPCILFHKKKKKYPWIYACKNRNSKIESDQRIYTDEQKKIYNLFSHDKFLWIQYNASVDFIIGKIHWDK